MLALGPLSARPISALPIVSETPVTPTGRGPKVGGLRNIVARHLVEIELHRSQDEKRTLLVKLRKAKLQRQEKDRHERQRKFAAKTMQAILFSEV